MATTKLWHIQGRLKDLVDYVENPEKTVKPGLQDFFNVFSYTQNPDKTAGGQFVTAINCQKDIALQQMILTKQRYGKEDGYIAWHGYQSFKPGEVTPEQCHALGVELAKQMWGGRFQIIVTTHLDKEHLHNHFCINSVSFKDGGKYNFSKKELKRLRDTSDRLCREHGLSVVERPHKAPTRQVWLDEQAGKPTRYNIYRADVQQAIDSSITGRGMVQYLRGRGYIVDSTEPNLKIRLPQYPHFTRLDTLNPQWTNQGIEHLIYDRDDLISSRSKPPRKPDIPDWLRDAYQPQKRTTKIYRLYLYYCYQLGILPKGTTYHPASPQLRADLRHLDDIDQQTRYLASHNIETVDELLADRTEKEMQLETLTAQRTNLRNKIRRASPEQKILLRKEKAEVTAKIAALRKDIRDSKEIEQRSLEIQNTLDRAYEAEHPQYEKNKRMEVNQNRGR
jgi:hypothetical protein